MKTLSISLPDPLDAYVAEKVSSGGYSSASEVVREGLRLLQQYEHERLRALRAAVKVGIESLDRGEGLSLEKAHKKVSERRASPPPRK